MDDFVRNKLTEWGLSDWIEIFKDEGVNKKALECLEDQEINELIQEIGPRAIFKRNLKLLKEGQKATCQKSEWQEVHEEAADYAQDGPSTSESSHKGKRKSEFQNDFSKMESPTKKQKQPYSEEIILSDVKNIIRSVYERLHLEDNNTKFIAFLKDKICNLAIDQRELIGVFGKSGAGKSSLINAIIEERNLLPSGDFKACTSVMIKIEANMQNSKYEAEIEFINKEEWEEELSSYTFLGNEEDDNEVFHCDVDEKLSALYREEWKNKSPENLMDKKFFKEIPEFFTKKKKILTCDSAAELSAKCIKYTRSDSSDGEGKTVKQWYWPLVKCVTVRVPNSPLLQHVTLVDLPGSGDRNKSRDGMWKEIVGSCSTVWIVAEMNRAVSEREPWEVLESASRLMGNGGQCQRIHFICTKSDVFTCDDQSADSVRAQIFKRNMKAKEEVQKEFNKLNNIKGDSKTNVCLQLEKKMRHGNEDVRKSMEETLKAFEAILTEGVEKSISSCETNLRSVLYPKKKGSGFHRTLKCVVKNNGVHKPKKGKQINLNVKLSSDLTDSIDEEFRKTFPNEGKCAAFNGVISCFSLGTDNMIEQYKDVELQLIFLKTEEEKLKTTLNKIIRDHKKMIYNSLTDTVEDTMEKCYKSAAEIRGADALKNMRETLEKHLRDSKNITFKMAKNVMLHLLKKLMNEILETLDKTLSEAIEVSLQIDDHSIPDFSKELDRVKRFYNELKGNSIAEI